MILGQDAGNLRVYRKPPSEGPEASLSAVHALNGRAHAGTPSGYPVVLGAPKASPGDLLAA